MRELDIYYITNENRMAMTEDNMKQLIASIWRTPDGTFLNSRIVHDFVSHDDKVAQETYFVDGGTQYIRTSVNTLPMANLCAHANDHIAEVRKKLRRGTLMPDGSRRWVILKNMSDKHVESCITYNIERGMGSDNPFTIQYIRELAYRFDNGISVPEHEYTDEDERLEL